MTFTSSQYSSYSKAPNGLELNVSAPGKVILHGEHSVVYGKLALAASLGLRTRIHAIEIDSPNVLIFKVIPLNVKIVFNLHDLEKLLLGQPASLNTDTSYFNWEYPDLVDHNGQMKIVDTALNAVNESPINDAGIKPTKCLFYFLSGILSSTNVKLTSLCITVDSDLEMGAGTGSSASFCVTLAATILQYLKLKTLDLENVSKNEFMPFSWSAREKANKNAFIDRQLEAISNWAYCGEKIFHGTPSGVDNTVCTFGNMVKFRKHHVPDIIKISNVSFDLLLINTNVYRETHRLVAHVAKLREAFPPLVNHILDAMEDLTVRAVDIVRKMDNSPQDSSEDFYDLATLVQINHGLLCALGVSHPTLEEIVLILEQHGIKGKLTGAGGGGFAIALLPPEYHSLENVVSKLTERGFGVTCTKLGGEGVTVY